MCQAAQQKMAVSARHRLLRFERSACPERTKRSRRIAIEQLERLERTNPRDEPSEAVERTNLLPLSAQSMPFRLYCQIKNLPWSPRT
jgi:hypothetical protein